VKSFGEVILDFFLGSKILNGDILHANLSWSWT